MSEITIAAYTAFFGVLVLVVGQLVQKFLIDPIQKQREIIGQVAFAVVYYRNVTGFVKEEEQAIATTTLRELAGKLRASLWEIPFYKILAFFRVIPSYKSVLEASQSLIGWSNSIPTNSIENQVDEIIRLLHLPKP